MIQQVMINLLILSLDQRSIIPLGLIQQGIPMVVVPDIRMEIIGDQNKLVNDGGIKPDIVQLIHVTNYRIMQKWHQVGVSKCISTQQSRVWMTLLRYLPSIQ